MISNSVNILSDLGQQYACYADWLLHFGQVFEKEKKYNEALEQFELCLKLYKEQEDSDGINRTEAKIAELKEIMLHK